ncbi:hypothetical protein [Corynebacterium lubricantis]|uniref:hypothetical protein n=1 Tax=Corynebacterium lubricantis TaxID=541095 RepID=UPI00036A689C|nr:hypothetical protein [Corynebacterium lubricantis]
MRKAVIGTIAAATLLVGCSSQPEENSMVGPTWQVVSLYTTPGSPDELPQSAAGAARFVFGESSIAGNTGCSPFQAAVRFTNGEEEVATIDASEMTFENIEYMDTSSCDGGSQYVHDELHGLFTIDSTFEIDHLTDTEIVLTKADSGIEPPSIRLMKQ